jgi:hypothetical protein
MSSGSKPSFWKKVKNSLGGKKTGGNCVCKELPAAGSGQWYCHTWDGGILVQCPGSGPFNSKEECEAARCDG